MCLLFSGLLLATSWLVSGPVCVCCFLLLASTALAGYIAVRESQRSTVAEQRLNSLRNLLIANQLGEWVTLPNGERMFVLHVRKEEP